MYCHIYAYAYIYIGFPDVSVVKNMTAVEELQEM